MFLKTSFKSSFIYSKQKKKKKRKHQTYDPAHDSVRDEQDPWGSAINDMIQYMIAIWLSDNK